MADIYCDNTNGNDTTGTGAAGTPYKTIQKGVDNAAGGDVIWIGDTSAQVLSTAISWSSGWSAGTGENAYLTVRGWDYSGGAGVDGDCVIDCNSAAVNAFSTTSQPNYVFVYRVHIKDATGFGWDGNGQRWHFERCEVSGCGGGGIDNAGYQKVRNCYIHDNTGNGVEVSGDSLVTQCFITRNSAYNVHCQGSFCVITHNLLTDPGTTNINIESDDVQVEHNTLVGDGTTNNTGITLSSNSGSSTITNNIITDHAGGTGKGINILGNKPVVMGNNQFNNNDTNIESSAAYLLLTDSTTDPDYVATGIDDYTPQAFVDAYPTTYPGSGTTTESKIGAVQEAGGAAGGGLMEPGSMTGGMV